MRVLRWKLGLLKPRLLTPRQLVQRLLLVRKLRKLIEENVALQKFMSQLLWVSHCCSCGVPRRSLQSVNSVVSGRCGKCC